MAEQRSEGQAKISNPRGLVFSTKNFTASLTWNPAFGANWTARFREVQKFVDGEVLRLSEPYIPLRTGMLVKLGVVGTNAGPPGEVVWLGPYARFLYYGKVMIGQESRSPWARLGEKKVVTDRDLRYHGGGQRGSFWFERMKQVHEEAIVTGAQTVLNRGFVKRG